MPFHSLNDPLRAGPAAGRIEVMKPSGTPPPPPVFHSLPSVESIEPTSTLGTYRVVLREPGGHPKAALFSIQEVPDRPTVTKTDWDILWRWPGDAQSVRAVFQQVRGLPPLQLTGGVDGISGGLGGGGQEFELDGGEPAEAALAASPIEPSPFSEPAIARAGMEPCSI